MNKRVGVVALLLVAQLFIGAFFGSKQAVAVNNFTITNYDVEMELGRDSDGRSTLRTIETITADFPESDENHGLERVMVKDYDGHGTSFSLESVTDDNGNELPYHWSGDALRIGDKDEYVHGLNTYQIIYTQRDVTRHYEDTGKDEFYWDAIGTEWRVLIERASVWLTIAPELQDAVETDLQCYAGSEGSTETCEAEETATGVYRLSVQDSGQSRGVTIALGFSEGTFAEYEPSLLEKLFGVWIVVTAITSVIAIAVIAWMSIRAHRLTYRDSEVGTIVPEYIPPKNASVAVSAAVSPGHNSTAAAELTDLAVRHYIQIIETREKSFWRSAEYDINVVRDTSNLRAEEREILKDMFGHMPKVGERLALKTLNNNTSAYKRFRDNDKKLRELMRKQYNFKQEDETKRHWFSKAAKVLFVVAILLLSPTLLVASIVAFVISKTLWVLSDDGLALRRYLKGLEMYIKVAEEERLKMLQSPDGAEKVATKDATNPAKLVKLYERVLPYAILFGQEKQWSKRLGEYYVSTETNPSWYAGRTAFNAAAFSTAMSGFSSSVQASSASSSSGGSGGGGSVGGGGGGGGGGGW